MSTEQKERGITTSTTPSNINYGIFDHVVTLESMKRVCVCCGEKLRRKQRAIGIITNGAINSHVENIPSNFFIHSKCSGAIEEMKDGWPINTELLGQKIDEIVNEYRMVNKFVAEHGSKWGIKMFRYGDD